MLAGIDIYAGTKIKGFHTRDDSLGKIVLSLDNGSEVAVDHIVLAVGIEPNVELGKKAGLEVDPVNGGLLVNAELAARENAFVVWTFVLDNAEMDCNSE